MSFYSHSWCSPPDKLVISKYDVHVWKADIEKLAASLHTFAAILSYEERRRAERYRFERDRVRYIIAKGVLRIIIGNYYLTIDPTQIEFCYGTHGKPFLEKRFGDGKFHFNQSDSNGIVLYAFAIDRQIGIDLEYIRDIVDAQSIVANNFSEYEKKSFNALPTKDKKEAFFKCWTRKEAYIKAIGKGLYYPLDQFDVSVSPNEPPKIIRIDGSSAEASKWTLADVTTHSDYSAALAFEGVGAAMQLYEFPRKVNMFGFH